MTPATATLKSHSQRGHDDRQDMLISTLKGVLFRRRCDSHSVLVAQIEHTTSTIVPGKYPGNYIEILCRGRCFSYSML